MTENEGEVHHSDQLTMPIQTTPSPVDPGICHSSPLQAHRQPPISTSPRKEQPPSPSHSPKPGRPLGTINIVNIIDSVLPVRGHKRSRSMILSESSEKPGRSSQHFDNLDDKRRPKKQRPNGDNIQIDSGSSLHVTEDMLHLNDERLCLSKERLLRAEDMVRENEELREKFRKLKKELQEMKDKMTSEEIQYLLG